MTRRSLLVLYAIALGARLAWVIVFRDLGLGLDDMFQYDMLARSLAAGQGFRWYRPPDLERIAGLIGIDPATITVPPEGIASTFRPPLYPAFLALIYLCAGWEQRLLAARGAQAALTASLAPLTALLAHRLGVKPRGAVIAGAILAVYPLLTLYPLTLLTENLFWVLTLSSVMALLHAAARGRRRDYAVAGVILGLAMLTRSVIAAFLPLAAGWTGKRGRNGARGALILSSIALGVTLPWAIRNSHLTGRPVFIETSLGYQLFIGYYPGYNGYFTAEVAIQPLKIINDAERDRWALQQTLNFIRAAPLQTPLLILYKWGYFWGLEKRGLIYFYSNGFFGYLPPYVLLPLLAIFILPPVVVVTLALPGMVCPPSGGRHPPPATTTPSDAYAAGWELCLLFTGAYILPHLITIAEDRFHLTLLPYLAACAGHAWSARAEINHCLRTDRRRYWLIIGLLVSFGLIWGGELVRDWSTLTALLGPQGWQMHLSY